MTNAAHTSQLPSLISDAQTARGAIKHECAECGAGYATRDELHRHELKTDHDIEGY